MTTAIREQMVHPQGIGDGVERQFTVEVGEDPR